MRRAVLLALCASCAGPAASPAVDAAITVDGAVDAATPDAATDAPPDGEVDAHANVHDAPPAIDANEQDAPIDARMPLISVVPCTAFAFEVITGASNYSPTMVAITVGQVVRFAPTSPHDVKAGTPADPEPWFQVDGNDPRCLRFDEAGTFPFFCQSHPTMVGRVQVTP